MAEAATPPNWPASWGSPAAFVHKPRFMQFRIGPRDGKIPEADERVASRVGYCLCGLKHKLPMTTCRASPSFAG